MPLRESDERFIKQVQALNKYFFILAIVIFAFIFIQVIDELRIFIFIIGVMFFLIYWLTDKLLTIAQILDVELKRTLASLKRIGATSVGD